ncbi:MAG TPA: DUF481 domain-containing protein, partial [Chitinophagaceae bacterium]|nr:DUF481 domain-containing protein [Chitinophagaceae bacterium]
ILLLNSCWLLGTATQAQIVNIESARMQSDTVGWMGGAGLGATFSQNGKKFFGVDAEAHLQYKTSNDQGLWLILGNYQFFKGDGVYFSKNQFLHLRYNRKINEWLRWEFFGQYQDNLVTNIDHRILFGTGPRFKIIKNSVFRLYAASLVMFENEKELTTPVVRHRDVRSSSYVSFTLTPKGTNTELISTTFFQPLFSNFADYRILNQIMLKVKATKHFSISVRWNYLHDRFPAGDAPRTTYSLGTGATFDL